MLRLGDEFVGVLCQMRDEQPVAVIVAAHLIQKIGGQRTVGIADIDDTVALYSFQDRIAVERGMLACFIQLTDFV